MLQDVLGVDVGILLGSGLKGTDQQSEGKQEPEKSHGVEGGENKGVRGHNGQGEGNRTCGHKSPMFMPKEKWNWPRAMEGAEGTSSKRQP